MNYLDWSIIAAYMLLSLLIGLYYKKRAEASLQDFFVGGRKFPWYLAGVSMVATTFAADTPLAVTELVSKNGISGNWLWWNFLIGGMLTTIFFAHLWRRSGVVTELELIELRYSGYGALILRRFKALYLGVFMNVIILGWVNLAMMTVLEIFFDLEKGESLIYIAATMSIAALYSSLSGIWGVAVTDFIQFFLAMAGCIVLAVCVLDLPEIGGMDGLIQKIPNTSLHFFPSFDSTSNITGALSLSIGTFLAYVTMQWWASWYPGAEPGGGGYVAQRMLSCKDEKHAFGATLFFQIAHYCIRPWPWIIVGLASVVLFPDLADPREGYVMAMKNYLPNGLIGLLLASFFAAYMSTISTQLNWGASFMVNDFYLTFKNKNEVTPSQIIPISRISTIALMVFSVFITQFMDSISGAWTFLIECGAGLGLVLILRWYWWRINVWSEISATLSPFVWYAVGNYGLKLEFPESFFFTISLTTITWLSVTFLTKPEKTETLERFYNQVKPGGFWNKITKKKTSGDMAYRLLLWYASTISAYASLFLSGKILFKQYHSAGLWAMVLTIHILIVIWTLSKGKIKL